METRIQAARQQSNTAGGTKPSLLQRKPSVLLKFFDEAAEQDVETKKPVRTPSVIEKDALIEKVRQSVLGRDGVLVGPYGRRPLLCADYIASGRALSFIEDFIRQEVMPTYANTHTTTSATGRQTTQFRHEARAIIAKSVNAGQDDAVLFTGSGVTGALAVICRVLGLNPCPHTETIRAGPISADESLIPVVFIGPYEHHSNQLPWRECGADVICIPEDPQLGGASLPVLEMELKKYPDRKLKIGTFSAASNVSGIITPVQRIAQTAALLHKYGALSIWDYATAGPYVPIDMNPQYPYGNCALDAICISPHKFVGGPGTPGVLVIKKYLLNNPVPSTPGGGTVFFVTSRSHRYLMNYEEREEGGTPDIIGSIRCGLVFQLKQAVGAANIEEREHAYAQQAMKAFRAHPKIAVLGNPVPARLAVFSFSIRAPKESESSPQRFLHHSFVCCLLNDLFGIQCRGGCACAAPYGATLFGMSVQEELDFESALVARRQEILRPGFSRINLNYFATQEEVQFIIDAVLFIAEHGWKFLPQYSFNMDTGEWRHRSRIDQQTQPDRKWLANVSFLGGNITWPSDVQTCPSISQTDYISMARDLAEISAEEGRQSTVTVADQEGLLTKEGQAIRWFMLPAEAIALLRGEPSTSTAARVPIKPRRFDETDSYPTDPALLHNFCSYWPPAKHQGPHGYEEAKEEPIESSGPNARANGSGAAVHPSPNTPGYSCSTTNDAVSKEAVQLSIEPSKSPPKPESCCVMM